MIISDPKQFMFFAAGRTGTTSIERRLEEFGTELALSEEERKIFDKHIPPAIAKERFSTEIWNEYFKFAFVRNPWDWTISRYCYALKLKLLPPRTKGKIGTDDILYLCHAKHAKRGITWAPYRTQFAFLSDAAGDIQVDYIGRFETLQKDFNHICDRLGIPRFTLARLNESSHEHYSQYYTEQTMKLVETLYNKDIEIFGYSFS